MASRIIHYIISSQILERWDLDRNEYVAHFDKQGRSGEK